MILFLTNLIIKFYNAFAIHKAIGKQASITKILLTGIFGMFSQTLTQLVAQIQEEENSHDSDENYSHYTKHKKQRKNIFRRHSSDIAHKQITTTMIHHHKFILTLIINTIIQLFAEQIKDYNYGQ